MTSPGQATTIGIGAALRAERERLRVSLDTVERGTLIRRDFLELIDADRFSELPSGAYGRGFIRAYAAYLALDPAPFLKVYDDHFARPEPELASVVQKGVRVPPDLSRRAWKIAVGAAVGMVLLLAALGAFRSDGKPESIPRVSVAAARVQAQAVPDPMGAVVRVDIVGGASWVEATADGQRIFGQTLQRGESRTFKASDRLSLYLARAQVVRIVANGEILGTPAVAAYRGTFTSATTQLPDNEIGKATPAPSASGAPMNLPAASTPGAVSPQAPPSANVYTPQQ